MERGTDLEGDIGSKLCHTDILPVLPLSPKLEVVPAQDRNHPGQAVTYSRLVFCSSTVLLQLLEIQKSPIMFNFNFSGYTSLMQLSDSV